MALGRTLDLRVVAEGIEEPGQLERLRELGCEFGQGYLFARPGPIEGLASVLGLTGTRIPSLTGAGQGIGTGTGMGSGKGATAGGPRIRRKPSTAGT